MGKKIRLGLFLNASDYSRYLGLPNGVWMIGLITVGTADMGLIALSKDLSGTKNGMSKARMQGSGN